MKRLQQQTQEECKMNDNRKRPLEVDESITNTHKRIKYDDSLLIQQQQWNQIDENVWSHNIIHFVPPYEYLNLRLTSKMMNELVEQNDSYRFCYLLSGEEGDDFPVYMMPSASFLSTTVPYNIQSIFFRNEERRTSVPATWLWIYKENVVRELMKLFKFDLKYARAYIDWFKQDAKNIRKLTKIIDNRNISDISTLITDVLKYGPYLRNTRKRFINALNSICDYFIDVTDRDTIKALIRISPNIVFHSKTRENLKQDRELVLMAVRSSGQVLQYVTTEFQRDMEIKLYACCDLDSDDVKELLSDPDIVGANRHLVRNIIKQNGALLMYADIELQLDKELVLVAASNSDYLEDASDRWQDDFEVMCAYIKNDCENAIEYMSDNLLNNREVMRLIHKCDSSFFMLSEFSLLRHDLDLFLEIRELTYFSEAIRNNKRLAILAVKKSGSQLSHCCKELQNDEDVVYAAVSQVGFALQYASRGMQSNIDIVIRALDRYSSPIYSVSNELKKNLLFIQYITAKALTKQRDIKLDQDVVVVAAEHGVSLCDVSNEFRSNRDIVMQAVIRNGYELQYASSELRNTRAVVAAAVRQNGESIIYASETLREDYDFALLAVKTDGLCIQYMSQELQSILEITLEAVMQNGLALGNLSPAMRCDRDLALTAVKQNGISIKYLPYDWILQNRDIVVEAVRQNGKAVFYLPDLFKHDREICLIAVRQNGKNFKYLVEELRRDKEIIIEATKSFVDAFVYKSTNACHHTRCDVIEFAQYNGNVLSWASPEYQSDKEIVRIAVKQNSLSFQYATLRLRRDREFVLELIHIDPKVFDHASIELKTNKKFIEEAMATSESSREYIQNSVNDLELLFGKIL
jgi:hypothetical protein